MKQSQILIRRIVSSAARTATSHHVLAVPQLVMVTRAAHSAVIISVPAQPVAQSHSRTRTQLNASDSGP